MDEIYEPDETNGSVEQIQAQEQPQRWTWLGSPKYPGADKYSDGISDLFEFGNETDTDDLISVDIDRDIVDAGNDGTLNDLVDVTEQDIMGDDNGQQSLNYEPEADVYGGQSPLDENPLPQRRLTRTPPKRVFRSRPPMRSQMGGMRG